MKLVLTATVEVNEKYAPRVGRDFVDYIQGLPAKVGGLEVGECSAEQVSQRRNAKGDGAADGPKGKSSAGSDA